MWSRTNTFPAFRSENISCEDYDPIFFPGELQPGYDFIFATECFEHFFFPAKEIRRLFNLLNEDGFLIIMTDQWKKPEQFKTWYYAKDPTHVAFYHKATINYICKKFGLTQLPCEDERVFILKKEMKAVPGNEENRRTEIAKQLEVI